MGGWERRANDIRAPGSDISPEGGPRGGGVGFPERYHVYVFWNVGAIRTCVVGQHKVYDMAAPGKPPTQKNEHALGASSSE